MVEYSSSPNEFRIGHQPKINIWTLLENQFNAMHLSEVSKKSFPSVLGAWSSMHEGKRIPVDCTGSTKFLSVHKKSRQYQVAKS